LYLETFSTDDSFSGPQWARIEITPKYLQALFEFWQRLKSSGASEMRRWEEVDELEGSDDVIGLLEGELVVLPDGFFWYRWEIKHGTGGVETRGLTVPELISLLQASDEEGSSTIVHGADVDGLKEILDEDEVVCFCDECGIDY